MTDSKDNIRMPRSILILPVATYGDLTRSREWADLHEDADEALVIPYSGKASASQEVVDEIRALLSEQDLLESGSLLIRSPYDADHYERAEDAIEAFASAKYHEVALIAGLLGARSVRFVEVKVDQNRSRAAGALAAKIPAASAKADVSQDVARNIEKRLEGDFTFDGADPDIKGARDLIKRKRLSSDRQIAALVEMRAGTNPIKRYRITMNGTRESTTNVKSALRIAHAGPIKAADIGVDFVRTVEAISRIEITTEIEF